VLRDPPELLDPEDMLRLPPLDPEDLLLPEEPELLERTPEEEVLRVEGFLTDPDDLPDERERLLTARLRDVELRDDRVTFDAVDDLVGFLVRQDVTGLLAAPAAFVRLVPDPRTRGVPEASCAPAVWDTRRVPVTGDAVGA
jgi:hypothetical protein